MDKPQLSFFQRNVLSPVLRKKAKRLGEAMDKWLADAQKILDFGCGDMILHNRMCQRWPNRNFVALDVLDTSLIVAKPFLYDGTDLPFSDNHFDLTFAVFALHHCDDVAQSLSEICRVTRGRILMIEEIITGPIQQKVTCIHDWIVNRMESSEVNIPVNFHRDTEWRQFFADLGYQVTASPRVWQLPFFNLTHQRLYVLDRC